MTMGDGANAMMGPAAAGLGGYVNAFRAGRAEAAAGPAGPNALTGAARPPDLVAGLTPQARAAGARRAEILGAVGRGLMGRPYAERRALLAHMAAPLAAHGLAPEEVARFDPTDSNLAEVISHAQAARALLAG
jgi:hypothetical protein